MSTVAESRQWDLEVFFPSLESPEFESAFQKLGRDIEELGQLFSRVGIGSETQNSNAADAAAQALTRGNEILDDFELVGAYLYGLITTDSNNDAAQARMSELDNLRTKLMTLRTKLTAWLGEQDVEALISQSEVAQAHAYFLRRAKVAADHLMSPAEEELAAQLSTTGSNAWSKLHGNLTSMLMVEVELPTGRETLPMSAIRNLAHDSNRTVRRNAYQAELEAWKKVEVPLAAAMNGIKGEVLVVSERRGWKSPLESTLFGEGIDQATLDAMLSAARESFPVLRRYLHAKGRVLGVGKPAFYDLFAPLGEGDANWAYEQGYQFVIDHFRSYSDKMGSFAERSLRERWTDAEPRLGKRDGAYCMPMRGDESRILVNFKPSFGGVNTLAHELGHAYHNLCLSNRTAIQRETPMSLAETASIFCETIVKQAALQQGDRNEQFLILEASLQGAAQIVLDISSRFLFESAVFDQRRARELSPSELSDAMLQAQKDTYGEGLTEELHPYMWAVKPHYYDFTSYYNFPYMFGMLFGLGLYAIYKQDPASFLGRYDELLSSTGMSDAATLAGQFGIDIRTPDFWRASLSQIAQDVERFEELTR